MIDFGLENEVLVGLVSPVFVERILGCLLVLEGVYLLVGLDFVEAEVVEGWVEGGVEVGVEVRGGVVGEVDVHFVEGVEDGLVIDAGLFLFYSVVSLYSP